MQVDELKEDMRGAERVGDHARVCVSASVSVADMRGAERVGDHARACVSASVSVADMRGAERVGDHAHVWPQDLVCQHHSQPKRSRGGFMGLHPPLMCVCGGGCVFV
jgi:hypothetical protein